MVFRHHLLVLLSSCFFFQCIYYADGNSTQGGYFITTTTGNSYVKTGVNLKGKQSFVFQVKSFGDAQVALVTTAGDYTHNMYEFAIDSGAAPKTCQKLRSTTMTNTVSRRCRIAVLSNGTVPVWLWISWTNGTITIGTGNITGENPILFYPENFLISNVSTVEVSSYTGASADWKIPYNQSADNTYYSSLQEIIDSDLSCEPVVCQDIVFSEAPGTVQVIDLEAIFVGRTSFKFQVNDFKSFINISLYSHQDVYKFDYIPPVMHIIKNGNEVAYYLTINAKPPLNGSPGYYWVSWKNGLVVFGFGQDIGKGSLMIHNEDQTIEIHNAIAGVAGTLTVPFRYYVGVTALQRKRVEYDVIKFKKLGSDMCASGAVIQSISLPEGRCRKSWCSLLCTEDKRCTAFCLHKPILNGTSCICELQAKPGTPSSSFLNQFEPGASYWEISA